MLRAQGKQFNKISGLSEIRRLPRLGKIRLGIKVKKAKPDSRCKHDAKGICMYCSYPKEVPYFVCPDNVKKIYGEQPTSLEVMVPIEDERISFPQALKWYVASHLKCKGDGVSAMRRVEDLTEDQRKDLNGNLPKDKNDLVEISCPCPLLESGDCSQMGNLMVLLPKVSMGGVFQLDTGSTNNIIRINSAMDYVRGLVGRVALVPLLLKRVPEVIEYQGKKATHYLLSLEFAGNIDTVNQLRDNTTRILNDVKTLALPAPVEDGPEPTGEPPIEQEPAAVASVPNVLNEANDGPVALDEFPVAVRPVEVSSHVSATSGKPYWTFLDEEGAKYFTGDKTISETISSAIKNKGLVTITVMTKKFGNARVAYVTFAQAVPA